MSSQRRSSRRGGRDRDQRPGPRRAPGAQPGERPPPPRDRDRLREPRRARDDERIVYGVGPVRALLEAGREVFALRVAESRSRRDARDPVAALVADAHRRGVAVEVCARATLDEIAPGALHQGVIAHAAPFPYADPDDLVAIAAERGEPALIVVLDGVRDPHNLGAIARSAHALGAHGLIIPRDRAADVTPAAIKVSAGATEHMAIAQVTNVARCLGELKAAGLWLAAVAAVPGARPLHEILDAGLLDARAPLALVVGAEDHGIRPLVAKQCDFAVEIPMAAHQIGSLNVSVAAAIALYEVARRRREHDSARRRKDDQRQGPP